MRFTEHEMTVAVEAVAQQLYAVTRPPWRRGGVDAAWKELTTAQTYRRKVAAGDIVLPVLTALPDRPTVGSRPEFSDAELAEAATAGGRTMLEHRKPGAWDDLSSRKQRRLVAVSVAMTRAGLAAMPVRRDPDALIVPDHL